MSYKYYNNNALGKFENDCTIRSISCATGKSWDYVYDYMSDLAQLKGTMMDDRDFILSFLSKNYKKVPTHNLKVGKVADMYRDNIILITMPGHITCSKFGVIYDSFDPRNRISEDYAYIVK